MSVKGARGWGLVINDIIAGQYYESFKTPAMELLLMRTYGK